MVRTVEDHLQYSLFPRIPPPLDRTEWDRLVRPGAPRTAARLGLTGGGTRIWWVQCLAPRAVPHPPFLTLKEVVPLSYAREIGTQHLRRPEI